MNAEEQTLSERIARLEQQNRRLKRFGSVAGLALAAVVLVGAAHKIDGNPTNFMNGKRLVARVGVRNDHAGLRIYDRKKSSRVYLGTDESDNPCLRFYAKVGGKRHCIMQIGVHDSGGAKAVPYIWTRDNKGHKVEEDLHEVLTSTHAKPHVDDHDDWDD